MQNKYTIGLSKLIYELAIRLELSRTFRFRHLSALWEELTDSITTKKQNKEMKGNLHDMDQLTNQTIEKKTSKIRQEGNSIQ